MSYVLKYYEQLDVFTAGDSTVHIRGMLLCDTVSDLPAPTDIAGFTLEAGSKAWIINGAVLYMMDTGGVWREQRSADLSSIITSISQMQSDITDLDTDLTTVQQKLQSIEPAVIQLINDGAKNMLDITATSTTVSGIQFTINSDGTVTADGVNPDKQATGNIYFQLGNIVVLNGDKIHLSGCPAGGSYSSKYAFYIDYQGGSTQAYDEGSGADYTSTADRTLRCRIIIRSGAVIDNLTFYPMIDYQAYHKITQDFKPYAPTNRELLDLIRSYHP